MLRSQQARGKHVVITELHLLAVNIVTRRRRTLRDEAILNECLFEDERFQCVVTMYHLPPVAKDCSGVYHYVRSDIVKDDAMMPNGSELTVCENQLEAAGGAGSAELFPEESM